MGLYANHGVEYRVVLRDGAHVVVAPVQATDTRLLASAFYRAREGQWFDVMYRGSFCRRISDADFDIELTQEERERLAALLAEHGGDDGVREHGWFDVNTIDSSYDW